MLPVSMAFIHNPFIMGIRDFQPVVFIDDLYFGLASHFGIYICGIIVPQSKLPIFTCCYINTGHFTTNTHQLKLQVTNENKNLLLPHR